jgi:ABC-2 type transport system ATP-binding protein
MPDLFEPADPGRRDRTLTEERGAQSAEREAQAYDNRPPEEPEGTPRSALGAPRSALRASRSPLLLFDHVSKWYGPIIGVNQVTLELYPGITGLVGANGAGKSTLMRLAAGQLRPDLGSVQVYGLDAWQAAARRYIGYSPDTDSFYEEMSGRQFLETLARLYGFSGRDARRRTIETLERVGMTDQAERRLRGYSKGMRQRIKVAQALIHDPQVLILDEPLSGIDPIGRQEFLILFRDLAARGKCLLVSSHELEELEKLTDHVAVMAQGRIAVVGTLARIRDLLDAHPLSILVGSDQPRSLAAALLALPDVAGVDIGECNTMIVKARNPQRFFHDFTSLILEENYQIEHLETLDDSAHAILGYLLGGRGSG